MYIYLYGVNNHKRILFKNLIEKNINSCYTQKEFTNKNCHFGKVIMLQEIHNFLHASKRS